MKSKNINLRLEEEKYKKLEEVAQGEETSVSAIVRKAIKEFINAKEVAKKQKKQSISFVAFHEKRKSKKGAKKEK